jgi:hypothetical protein
MLALPSDGLAKRKSSKRAKPAGLSTGQLRGVNLTPFAAFMPGAQSEADNQREIQGACQMGAGIVRVFVYWPLLEPSSGQVSPAYTSQLDSLISQAGACGIRVMFTLVTSPPWNSMAPAEIDPFTAGSYPPARTEEFHWMVAWILRQWPTLHSIEVWNEPNYLPYWKGTPADYAALVRAAVAAKREVGSSTLILAGGLASGVVDYLVDYLDQLYAAGLSGQDGISIHPYSMDCDGPCTLTDPGPAQTPFRAGITRIHDLMVAHGDRSGLWLTEFGYPSCPAAPSCLPEAQQARWLAKSIRIAACYPYVRGLTPFTIRDIPGDPRYAHVMDAHFGLLRTDFTPKPAYSALSSLYRGLGLPARRASKGPRRASKAGGRRGKRLRKSDAIVRLRECRRLLGSA